MGTQAYTSVLPEARHEISIDTGDSNHIIIGDAVKWVYVGE